MPGGAESGKGSSLLKTSSAAGGAGCIASSDTVAMATRGESGSARVREEGNGKSWEGLGTNHAKKSESVAALFGDRGH